MEIAWESPHRIKPEEWAKLVKDLGVVTPPDSARPVRLRKTKGAAADPAAPRSAWGIALARVGRVGRDLGEGRFALLCPWDDTHSEPEGSTENAAGSCVLLPPVEGSYMGLPKCSHAHCAGRRLRDWIEAVGAESYADALAEAQGWKRARGYLRTQDGVYFAKRVPLQLGDEPAPEPGELVEVKPGEVSEGPFKWKPGGSLLNFSVQIAADVQEHDVAGERRYYELTGSVSGRPFCIQVPAGEFSSLKWVAAQLGAGAVIEPGRGTADHARAAIQLTSTPVARDVYARTGWCTVGGREVYLHAGGAVGAEGAVEVRVEPRLAEFLLPAPLEGEALREGIRACAGLFLLAPEITAPLFSAAWRAPLGANHLTILLTAKPQLGKTLLGTLLSQHFGAGFLERKPAGSWLHDSAASLLHMLSVARDVVFLADDLTFSGTAEDSILRTKLDTVVRAVHNGAAPGRLKQDASGLVASNGSPGALLVVTGETPPGGQSLPSRMLLLEMSERLKDDLGPYKALGAQGVFAGTMAAYVRSLAPRISAIRQGLAAEIAHIAGRIGAKHDQRAAELLADVALGVKYFLEFAREHEALDAEGAEELRRRAWEAIGATRQHQGAYQQRQDPAVRFVDIVFELLRSGRAHLTTRDGSPITDPERWGWRRFSNARPPEPSTDGEVIEAPMRPSGTCLGYLVPELGGTLIYLHAQVTLAEVIRVAHDAHDPLPLTPRDLGRRLHDAGLLAKSDAQNKLRTFTARLRVGGHVETGLLCLRADRGAVLEEGEGAVLATPPDSHHEEN